MIRKLLLLFAAALLPSLAAGQSASFDLAGPDLQVAVTRGGTTLPIANVPGLAAGDRITVRAVLPKDQDARYLLVAAFLRGATNPPPRKWFAQAETWRKGKERLTLTVPDGASQLLLFLVPETGGDYAAVLRAVRAQPGTFVRAAQDLNQAAADRARLDAFLDAIGQRARIDSPNDIPATLTRSLAIRLDAQCLDRNPELQAACLTRARDSLVLADRNRDSLTETLTGAPVDLAIQLSNTPAGGYGYYSPYIGVLRDVARLFGAFRSAQFQYIPTLARHEDDRIGLLLNAAPSFREPKSVLVVAMPPVEPTPPPPLAPAEPRRALCITRPDFFLPVASTPAIYATDHAHDMRLRIPGRVGEPQEVPLRADPERGGYVPTTVIAQASVGGDTEALLHGRWGFAPFEGPRFRLQSPAAGPWRGAGDAAISLVVGRENQVDLEGGAASCVSGVELEDAGGVGRPIEWSVTDDRLSVKLPLTRYKAGPVTLLVRHHGQSAPSRVTLRALAEGSRLDGVAVHAGDPVATLTGSRLDLIDSVAVDGIEFRPGTLVREGQVDRLPLVATDPQAARALIAGQERTARLLFKDGRRINLNFTVAAPRPNVSLISRSIARPALPGALRITLSDESVVPHDARLTFSFRARDGLRFTGQEAVEVATVGGVATTLKAGEGLMLQDAEVAVAHLEPAKALGPSSHGPLRFRVVRDGAAGEWLPLGKLVRLPTLTGLTCTPAARPCTLRGENLFLIEAVAPNQRFTPQAEVPDGFTGATLTVPRPNGSLYLKLRDDDTVVASVAQG